MQSKKELLKEAKRLQNIFQNQGATECYCSQNCSAECPQHIEIYIKSLEWKKNETTN